VVGSADRWYRRSHMVARTSGEWASEASLVSQPGRVLMSYAAFLDRKRQHTGGDGFAPVWMPDFLFDFQAALVDWALLRGRAALFADCGLGKTPMQLVWAENVVRYTGGRVLILTPLAVSHQTVAEAEKFGIEASRAGGPITVANYERLHHYDPADFVGVVCDESSILKSFDGATKSRVTEFAKRLRYRLLCTATAAPNDYIELGTSSEALGDLGYTDMLQRFFKNDQNTVRPMVYRNRGDSFAQAAERAKWRFKGHAETPFWRWVSSWARALRRPSDLGYDDARFVLPPLVEHQHTVTARMLADGMLFSQPAVGLREQRDERRRTIAERCEQVATLVVENGDHSMIWCSLNVEGDLLEEIVPRSIQVAGRHSDDYKELAAEWFCGRRCICDEPLFSVKLTAWRKDLLTTGATTIARIAQNSSLGQRSTAPSTETPSANTPASITERTSGCGSGLLHNASASMRDDESDTRATQRSVGVRSKKSDATASVIPTRASGASSKSTASALTPIEPQSLSAARSADARRTQTLGDSDGYTPTTATALDDSADFSAPLAILDSASLQMIQRVLNGPPCICGHRNGPRRLISKAGIFGYGLNFQHCAHVTFFPSHSFEQYYQGVRRCWRFGQTRPVTVDVVATEGERDVLANLQRKALAADRMFTALCTHMHAAAAVVRQVDTYPVERPAWLS